MLEEIEEGTREIREMQEFNHQHDLLTISLDDEFVQEPMCEDILLDEEIMEQKFEEEPSFL